jgi:hypothetical protein
MVNSIGFLLAAVLVSSALMRAVTECVLRRHSALSTVARRKGTPARQDRQPDPPGRPTSTRRDRAVPDGHAENAVDVMDYVIAVNGARFYAQAFQVGDETCHWPEVLPKDTGRPAGSGSAVALAGQVFESLRHTISRSASFTTAVCAKVFHRCWS